MHIGTKIRKKDETKSL